MFAIAAAAPKASDAMPSLPAGTNSPLLDARAATDASKAWLKTAKNRPNATPSCQLAGKPSAPRGTRAASEQPVEQRASPEGARLPQ